MLRFIFSFFVFVICVNTAQAVAPVDSFWQRITQVQRSNEELNTNTFELYIDETFQIDIFFKDTLDYLGSNSIGNLPLEFTNSVILSVKNYVCVEKSWRCSYVNKLPECVCKAAKDGIINNSSFQEIKPTSSPNTTENPIRGWVTTLGPTPGGYTIHITADSLPHRSKNEEATFITSISAPNGAYILTVPADYPCVMHEWSCAEEENGGEKSIRCRCS